MAYMNVNWNATTYGTGFPANVIAQQYGQHIVNVKLASDTPNGALVAADVSKAWASFDVFDEAAVTTFEGIIEGQDNNGDWIICVTDPGDALFVYQKPLTPYENPKELTLEKHFYNKAGDVVRCYALVKFDRITVSADNLGGADPAAGKKITGVASKKMTVAA